MDLHDDTVNRLYSVAVSIFAIGGMVGGFSGGMIANRFGRQVIFKAPIDLSNNF